MDCGSSKEQWEEDYEAMMDIVYPSRSKTIYDLTLLGKEN